MCFPQPHQLMGLLFLASMPSWSTIFGTLHPVLSKAAKIMLHPSIPPSSLVIIFFLLLNHFHHQINTILFLLSWTILRRYNLHNANAMISSQLWSQLTRHCSLGLPPTSQLSLSISSACFLFSPLQSSDNSGALSSFYTSIPSVSSFI